MSIGFHTGARTNVGIKREANQDSYATAPGIVVVADGMGGHRGGEVASSLAVQEVIARFDRPDLDRLVSSVTAANRRILEAGAADFDLRGMGTTLVALGMIQVDGETILGAVNVGDSRMYRLVGTELQQVTEDHSLVAELIREGRLNQQEAKVHPQRNVVTRALGVVEHVEVDAMHLHPNLGDRYLLCSDGLVDEVDPKPILQVLADERDPQVAADRLVDAANAAGGNDNITVVIVDIVQADRASMAAATKSLASDKVPEPAPTFDAPQVIPAGVTVESSEVAGPPNGADDSPNQATGAEITNRTHTQAQGNGDSSVGSASRQRWSWRR